MSLLFLQNQELIVLKYKSIIHFLVSVVLKKIQQFDNFHMDRLSD